MAVILAMAAIGVWAIGTGRISYVVTYGVSMQPTYHAGDLVLVTKANSYQVGQIAAYYGAGGKVEVLHRIMGGGPDTGFVLKGDNNTSVDVDEPTADELIGSAIVHIPKVGGWVQSLLSPTTLGVLGFLLVGGGAAAAKSRRDIPRGRRKKKVKGMSGGGGGGSWTTVAAVVKTVNRLHPLLRILAVITVLAGLSGFALGVLGFIKPAAETVPGTGKPGESMTFSYSAEVPRSAAYDGTTVYSPDPVFRKLADLVILRMNYTGEPGRVRIDARLAAQNGWHTTVDLAEETQFSSGAYTGTVQLDLPALEQRARAAGEAIGADMGAVTLVVTARIEHADGTSFAPQLSLNLAPLALTLAGGAETLTVERSSAGATASLQDRRISAFGRDVLTAVEARRYAVYLLLVAIAGAIVVAMMALRHVPLRTRAQIERRYPHLIVPVEPMASPPGKPVVMVDTFPALVKLAERYGQMILTWTRPDGADDFVVRDEGITYRYRITPSTPEPAAPPITAEPEAPPSRPATSVSAPTSAPALPAAPEPGPQSDEPAEVTEKEPPPEEKAKAPEPATQEAGESKKKQAETPEPTAEADEPAPAPEAAAPVESTPAKPPAKRTRRPKPKPETVEPETAEADPEKPGADPAPKKRAPSPKPRKQAPRKRSAPRPGTEPADGAEATPATAAENERRALEDLAARNDAIPPAEAPRPQQPAIYEFLPPDKRLPS